MNALCRQRVLGGRYKANSDGRQSSSSSRAGGGLVFWRRGAAFVEPSLREGSAGSWLVSSVRGGGRGEKPQERKQVKRRKIQPEGDKNNGTQVTNLSKV